jgi:two-component system sensor histidine kinase CpxA
MLAAGEALREDGREGLVNWLESLTGSTSELVYVVDERRRDLLGRRLPAPIELALRRHGRGKFDDRRRPPDSRNFRPARPFSQLLGPSGELYTVIVLPPQNKIARWLTERGQFVLILIALLVSAGVSYLLARAISQPIHRFRESTVAIADGDLGTRVADNIEKRGDVIGALAQDLNRMAGSLELNWQRQAELTSNVSHELRSPLARLKVALELARRRTGELPELDRIDAETGKLDELVGQLLSYSKLGANEQERLSTVDLGDLIETVVNDVRYEFCGQALNIDWENNSDVTIEGYSDALRSALENVIRNAAIHGGSDVSVRLLEEGSNAVISVQDNGGGVPEETLRQLFEPFYRAQTNGEQHGAGLGLAIAARAIALHSGDIIARNEGAGLFVEIRLPLDATSTP